MKILKSILFPALFLGLYLSITGISFAEYKQVFRISAYYSPLPCQERYATGAYESDIRLNGRGTNGADGTPVYIGMIAAPKSFAFGTKINIPGYGIGAVHDRGGAIVNGNPDLGTYDRLDIWMGYGDEGLKRALNFGKRNLEVTVYGVDSSIKETFHVNGFNIDEKNPKCDGEIIPQNINSATVISSKPKTAPVVENTYGVVKDTLFYQGLMKGDNNSEVKRLQNELNNLNFLRTNASGLYDEATFNAVFKFQQSQGIVLSLSDIGAGYFGPTTRARLNEIISMRNENRILIAKVNENISKIAKN
jgi:3D (Asp-Asp-Asp) domain-containing protein